jgi:hypothetical protein
MSKMVKMAIAVAVVILLTLGASLPAFADQPAIPGCMGKNVSDSAKMGIVVDEINGMKIDADNLGLTFGQYIQWGLGVFCGIPPKHEP